MAIELEFCTALFPKKLIEEHFPGGIDAFFATCEAANFKEDEHLVGISLMATSYCHELYESLIENGYPKTYEGSVSCALVQRTSLQEDLPAWLNIGREGVSHVWHAEHEKGDIVSPVEGFLMRDIDVPFTALMAKLESLDVIIEENTEDIEDNAKRVEQRTIRFGTLETTVGLVIRDNIRLEFLWLLPPLCRLYGKNVFTELKQCFFRALDDFGINGAVEVALSGIEKLNWKSDYHYIWTPTQLLESYPLTGGNLVMVSPGGSYSSFAVELPNEEKAEFTLFVAMREGKYSGPKLEANKVTSTILSAKQAVLDGQNVIELQTDDGRDFSFSFCDEVDVLAVGKDGMPIPLG